MDITFTENGRTRKGILVRCKVCDKEFPSRKDQLRVCCSAECGHICARRRVEVACSNCGDLFEKQTSKLKYSKSGLYFCSRKCKDTAQRIENGFEQMWPNHFNKNSVRQSESYRRIYKTENNVEKLCCSRCGYCEFECGVDIHHKDKNHLNNEKSNLDALCAPCHRALHKGLWNY